MDVVLSLVWFILPIAVVGFWGWMIYDAATRPILNRTVWLIAIIAMGPLAAIIYYLKGRQQLLQSSPSSLIDEATSTQPPTMQV